MALDSKLAGRIETLCRRGDALVALGFHSFMVSPATPGTPVELRQVIMARFAQEIRPRYSSAMRKVAAA